MIFTWKSAAKMEPERSESAKRMKGCVPSQFMICLRKGVAI